MKLLIVDDHPLALQGVDFVLRAAGHDTVLAKDLAGAYQQLVEDFDGVLLDYHFADSNALAWLTTLDVALPRYIVIFSGLSDPEDIIFILESSPAQAFISKQIDLSDLPQALTQLTALDLQTQWVWNAGRQQFAPVLEAFKQYEILTPKERQVFMLLRQGLLDKQIADTLARSIHTIRVQIRSIKRKRKTIRRSV